MMVLQTPCLVAGHHLSSWRHGIICSDLLPASELAFQEVYLGNGPFLAAVSSGNGPFWAVAASHNAPELPPSSCLVALRAGFELTVSLLFLVAFCGEG